MITNFLNKIKKLKILKKYKSINRKIFNKNFSIIIELIIINPGIKKRKFLSS